ncbi:hypothetical protein [Salinispora arenicola]|nr:hypothetical protein [Salinispora arenicola]
MDFTTINTTIRPTSPPNDAAQCAANDEVLGAPGGVAFDATGDVVIFVLG